jgi:hypothetical protein
MKILTLITKRSVREPAKEKKFLKFFSTQNFEPGQMIEIIDGNKKSPAIILKSESASNLKEEIRSGELILKKLKFSKTGEKKDGKIFDNFEISEIKKFLKNPSETKKSENKNISGFFPRNNAKHYSAPAQNKKKRGGEISEISEILNKNLEKILNKKKTYNNPMQERVDKIRKYFYENSRYGYGSFSYYIGMFKQIPEREIDQIFAEVKQLKKPIFDKKKLF